MHATKAQKVQVTARDLLYMFGMATIIMLIANAIGTISIPIPFTKTSGDKPMAITFIPMVWSVIMGIIWGICMSGFPQWKEINIRQQFLSSQTLNFALLIFMATLAMNIGQNLDKVVEAGWALLFQEIGHFAGTIMLGLPIALMLGIKREAVGATFSVGREPNIAIIGEKYGMDSPEGRGVLAEYLTGTILGTLFITVFASLIAGLGWFDHQALAMGAGVGSGSMMAAASAAIKAQFPAELAPEIGAIAGAANLLTIISGTYVTLFISLPVANWAYKHLEPVLGRFSKASSKIDHVEMIQPLWFQVHFPLLLLIWSILALLFGVSFFLAQPTFEAQQEFLGRFPIGFLILLGVVLGGYGLSALTKNKIPAVCTVSALAMFISSSFFKYHEWVRAVGKDVMDIKFFVASTTLVLALAGLSIAKDIPAFRRLGWKIIVVSLCATAGTFLGATLIGQLFH